MRGMLLSFRRGGGRKYSRLPRRRGGLHRRGHDGPGPRARLSQRARAHDLAPSHVQNERWLGSDSGAGIRLGAVVIDAKLGELRQEADQVETADRKSTRLNSSHEWISYAVFCLTEKQHHTD